MSPHFLSMSKGDVQPGGQNNVILLQRRCGRRRIGYVDIAEGILPSQPFAQFGYAAEVKRYAILTGIAEVGKKIKFLRDHCRCPEFLAKFFPQSDSEKITLKSNVTLSGVGGPNQEIQSGSVTRDGVESQATSKHAAKIEFLQCVGLEVSAAEAKEARSQIVGISCSALSRVRGRAWARASGVVRRIDSIFVKCDFIGVGFPVASESDGKTSGIAVAASQSKSDVGSAVPTLGQFWMERLLIRGLLSIAAQSSHIGFHHRYSSCGSVYHHASVSSHDRTCDSSAVGQRDVQRLRRGD